MEEALLRPSWRMSSSRTTRPELTFDLSGAVGVENVEAIHANNIDAANENGVAVY